MARTPVGSREHVGARASASLGAASLVLLFAGCFGSLELPDAAVAQTPAPEPPAPEVAGEEWSPLLKSEQVDEILAKPVPAEGDVFGNVGKAIDHWTLAGTPSATGVDAYAGDNWGAASLSESIGSHGADARVTAGMTCVARQLGEFMDLYGVMPSFGLQEFILARCGSMVGRGDLNVRRFAIEPGGRKPSATGVRRMIDGALAKPPAPPKGEERAAPRGPALYGAWYNGDEHGGLLVVAHGSNRLGLEPFPMGLAGRDHVRISGRKPSEVERIDGYVTSGDGEYLRCKPATDVPRGSDRFALSCPVRSADSQALIDLVQLKRRRVLASKVTTLFVSPDGSLTSTYATRPVREGERSDAADARAVAESINELRVGVGLPPFILAEGQSEEMAKLLPYYLAASRDPAQAELADGVALAFLSGRKVDHVVVDAGFLHFAVDASDAAHTGRMLAQQAMSPMARSTLLDPDAQSLAIGTQRSTTHGAIAYVLATYEHPDLEGHVELEALLYDALNEARGRRGLPRIRQLRDRATNAIMDQCMGRLELGFGPEQQAHLVQEQLGKLHHRSFGFAFQGLTDGDVGDVEWPLQLLELEQVQVSIRVGYYRPEGTNWAHELVFVTYT